MYDTQTWKQYNTVSTAPTQYRTQYKTPYNTLYTHTAAPSKDGRTEPQARKVVPLKIFPALPPLGIGPPGLAPGMRRVCARVCADPPEKDGRLGPQARKVLPLKILPALPPPWASGPQGMRREAQGAMEPFLPRMPPRARWLASPGGYTGTPRRPKAVNARRRAPARN